MVFWIIFLVILIGFAFTICAQGLSSNWLLVLTWLEFLMFLMSVYFVLLFLGGWLSPWSALTWISPKIWLALKTVLLVFAFIWTRATLPRFRYDQLMSLGWKVFLPVSLACFLLILALLVPIHDGFLVM